MILIAYDIADDRRRAHVLKGVGASATGGQKSFYECWLTSGEMQSLMHTLRTLIEPEEDKILFVRLDPRASVRTLGAAQAPELPNYFMFA